MDARRFLLFLLLFGSQSFINAQICEGNLGENIFADGDFGSGNSTLLLTDPMIAPGYIYATQTPISDGYYTISNNMGAWPNNFGTWLDITDNSSDPNGYMMVVNASFDPGLFYQKTIDGLCENTLYVFTADIINVIRPGVGGHIEPNVSFLLDGQTYYTTGLIPQDANWKTYGFTFSTEPGQTSVELSLRNNAPGGIGNDLALDNIEFRACGPEAFILPMEIENICEDGSPIDLDATIVGSQYSNPAYQWQQSFDEGATWIDLVGENQGVFTHTDLSAGYYYYRYLLANDISNLSNYKCRVNSNIKIVHVVPKHYEIIDTICAGLSFSLGDQLLSENGIYIDSLLTTIGCDSIVTLKLSIQPDLGIEAEIETANPICAGDENGEISIGNVQNGFPPFTYEFEEVKTNDQIVYTNLGSGTYPLKIIDRFGCEFEKEVLIHDPEKFIIDIGEDELIDLGESINLIPNSNYPIQSFQWSPSPSNCQNCLEASWLLGQSSEILLEAISEAGCIAKDSMWVEVDPKRIVYIPNIFTPNTDGKNDYFTIFADIPNVKRIKSLSVFDRWGALVFKQENFLPNVETLGWNGKFKGKESDTGIYIYTAEIEFLDNQILPFSGDIMLIR